MNKKIHTMKISVAICTYNRPEQLKRCVQSIIAQGEYLFELIVVFHSKNDLREIKTLNKNQRVRFLQCSKTNSSSARNRAINNSKGTILAFIDDDCVANRHWLQRIIQQFEDRYCQIVMGKAINGSNLNIFSAIENARINYYTQSNMVTKKKKKYAHVLDTKNFAIRKSFLAKHNLIFDVRFTNKFEDVDFGFRVISTGANILCNPQILVRHFGTSDFLSHLKREFSIGYNYCTMKAKWAHRLNITIAKRLHSTNTNIIPPPISHILLVWTDTLFRLLGWLRYGFERHP